MTVYGFTSHVLDAMRILELHGGEMQLRSLALALSLTPAELRKQIANLDGLERTVGGTLVGEDFLIIDPVAYEAGGSTDAEGAEVESDDDLVTLVRNLKDVYGTSNFDAEVLGPLYRAAMQLAEREPHNTTLADAAEKLRTRFLTGILPPGEVQPLVADLQRAIEAKQKVRIVYSRAWEPGVKDVVIEPHRLVTTRRGWEIDAGPVQEDGDLRSYLVHRVRELTILDETFEADAATGALLGSRRVTTTVHGIAPRESRWVVEKWAERVTFGHTPANDPDVPFAADLLHPLGERCAMILLLDPRISLDEDDLDAHRELVARRLLEHHGL